MREIMQNRYSCRNFKNEKIDEKIITEILDLTRLSPSSMGLEPWKFLVVNDEKNLKILGEICANQPQVSGCSHAVIIMSRKDLKSSDEFVRKYAERKSKNSEQIAKRIAHIGVKTDKLSDEEIWHYADLQGYLACGNLVNIAESFGVKSCIIGAFDPQKLNNFADLGENFRPCIVVVLGLSDETPTPKNRQNLDEILVYKK